MKNEDIGEKSDPPDWKRKGSDPRSVSTLAAEQLARKRAADRVSQRALRQRTREHIERLEARVRQLSNTAIDGAKLEAAQRRGVELEKELGHLRIAQAKFKADIESLRATNIPSSSRNMSSYTMYSGSQNSQSDVAAVPTLEPARKGLGHKMSTSRPFTNVSGPIIGPDLYQPMSASATATANLKLQISNTFPDSVPIDSSQKPRPVKPRKVRPDAPDQYVSLMSQLPQRDQKTKVDDTATSLVTPPWARRVSETSFMRQPRLHEWDVLPNLQEPSKPIEIILYGMVQHQRELSNKGLTGVELAGPRTPSLSALVTPELSRPVHIVSRVISELLSRITYRTFVDKLAAFMVMYPVYQWLIMQSKETYHNMPSWSIPVHAQRTTPHHIWLSALGYPRLRELVIACPEKYATEEFQFLFVTSLNCNWDRGIEAALRWTDGEVTPSMDFVAHTRVLSNFTLNEPFQSRYPELKEYAHFTKRAGED